MSVNVGAAGGLRLGVAAALCGLTACAALPPTPEDRGVSVSDVVESVQCELKAAASKNDRLRKSLQDYLARAQLELRVIDSNQVGASALLVLPQAPETITASLGAGASSSSSRKTTLSFGMDMRRLLVKKCGSGPTGLPSVPLSLGLKDWVVSAFSAADDDDRARFTETAYTLEFVLGRSANGGISVVAYRITNATLGGGAARQDTHTLTVALSPRPPPGQPADIRIVNWPAAVARPSFETFRADPGEQRKSAEPGADQRLRPRRTRPVPELPDFRRLDQLIERERLKRITVEP